MKPAPASLAEQGPQPQRRLPEERVAKAGAGEIAWLVLAPLALALGLNLAVAEVLAAHPTNRAHALMRLKWDMVANPPPDVDTLVVGDSSCNQGVRPDVLSAALGGRAINLCTTGDSIAVGPAWMIGAYVERFGAPRRVILMHAYDVWKRDDERLRRQAWVFGRHHDLFLGRAPELDWSARERALVYVGERLPLYSQPSASRTVLWNLDAARAYKPFKIDPDGFMPSSKARAGRVERDARKHIRRNKRRKPVISRYNRAAVSELARLSAEHGFALFVVHGPVFAGVWASEGVRRYHNGLSDKLEDLIAPAPRARLLFRTPRTYPAKRMENVDHVVGSAAADFTVALAEEVARAEAELSVR
jgi:hypothetical protein